MSATVNAWIAVVGLVAAAFVGAFAQVWISRQTRPAQQGISQASLQQAINSSFEELMEQRDKREQQLNEDVTTLTGYVRELIQHIDSLEALLRKKGVAVPKRRTYAHPLSVITGGKQP